MSISSLLSTIIAISFLYFILSVIASTLQETVAGWLTLRPKTLLLGLNGLLQGERGRNSAVRDVAQRIIGHDLVSGIVLDRKPAYLPAAHFSTAIIDVLTQGSQAPQITAIQHAVADLPDMELKSVLSALLRQTGGDLEAFRSAVDKWYDNAMERLGGIYKRKSQMIILMIGLALAVLLNVDTIRVIKGLSHSDHGAAIAQAAEAYVKAHPDGKLDSVSQYLDQLDALSLDIGWKSCTDLPPSDVVSTCKGSVADFLNRGKSDLMLSLGTVVGWLLSAALISFGAPFWFDLMTTFVNIRSAGTKPKPAGDEKLTG